jgi:uncharacterized protein
MEGPVTSSRLTRSTAIAAGLSLATLGGLVALQPAATAADSSTIFINEFHYDNASTDTGEFIEVAAPAGTDLSGWSLVLYNGEGTVPGQSYNTRALSGVATDQQGGYGTLSFTYPANGIQNGPVDGIALVRPDGGVEQFLSYEGTLTASNGPASGQLSEDIGVSQASTEPVGSSLQLTGTGLAYGDFTWSVTTANTAGQPNTGQVFEEPPPPPESDCDAPATACIHEIQGSGDAFDPVFGGVQTIQGVVTDVLLGGMHVQEEAADSDADPATSDGIFVFLGGQAAPSIGSTALVTGTVGERFGMTQISNVTRVEDQGPSTPIEPTEVTFPVTADGFLERYEGMLVRFGQHLVISEYFEYDRFGEVVAGVPPNNWERFFTPTAVVEPGSPAQDLAADYATRLITIDDRSDVQNPAVIPHPGNGQPFSLTNRFRGGDTITGIEGVIQFSFGVYRLQPTTYGTFTEVNPRPITSPDVGGSVRVASANVLNYFLTLDASGNLCGPVGNKQECRGANDAEELARQRAKVVANLAALDADVIGLMEMENSPGQEPAEDLAAGLNDIYGPGTYSYIDTGVIGTDAIRVGLIYRTDTVRPVGDYAILDESVDPRFLDDKNRPMLTQTFDEILGGGRFTVSVNHLKSKGSDCDDVADPDLGDGQGNCNLTRTAAAEAIVDFLATDPTNSGDPDHLIIGDLNSYDHEDPIDVLVAGGYADQVKRFQGEFAYSYVFDGQNGYLDHALANPSLAAQVTGADDRHINADEPDLLDYDTTFKPPAQELLYEDNEFRSSDHDPVLIGLALTPADQETCYADGAQRVADYEPGLRKNGTRVPPAFGDPTQALGLSDPDPDDPYWTSLGLEGELVLAFDNPIHNNNGSAADLRIHDAADGAKGAHDSATVYASFDGETWVPVGAVRSTGTVDLGALAAAHYVKVVDTTEGQLKPSSDGYDLDAVEVLTGCV